jgi:hypothetical protein
MPQSVVREELEALDIHVHEIMRLPSGRRDQDPAEDRPRTHPILCISGAMARGFQGAIYHRTLGSSSVGGVVCGSQRLVVMQTLRALRPHAA